MPEVLLAIFFWVEGTWLISPAFEPVPMYNTIVCEEMKREVIEALSVVQNVPPFFISCYESVSGTAA